MRDHSSRTDGDAVDQDTALRAILDEWAEAIRVHDLDRIAALFAPDAVFQGSDPTYSVGRAGVAAYYGKRPTGLTPRWIVREIRVLAAEAFSAYVDVDFVHPSGRVDPTHLALVLVRDRAWSIVQYHVAKVETLRRTANPSH